jgi:hypothetical protein
MSPDPGKHDTFVDVEPFTGIVMNACKRVQINFEVAPSEFYRENITDTVMPVAWFEQRGQITQDLASQFKDQLYFGISLRDNLPLVFLGIGATLFVLGAAALYRVDRRKAIGRVKQPR